MPKTKDGHPAPTPARPASPAERLDMRQEFWVTVYQTATQNVVGFYVDAMPADRAHAYAQATAQAKGVHVAVFGPQASAYGPTPDPTATALMVQCGGADEDEAGGAE